MSIRNLQRFYTAENATSFVVYDSAPAFATTDKKTIKLTHESPKSTKSDLARKEKSKSMRFLEYSGLPDFRSKLEYPAFKNSSVQGKDRG